MSKTRPGVARPLAAVFVALLLACAVHSSSADPAKSAPHLVKIDYNRDIRPILSGKCFTCHGADPKQVQAGLRLDVAAVATSKLASGNIAIVPGKPDKSALVARIFAPVPAMQMPPPGSNKTLTAAEKQTLKLWIAQGGVYKQHWAFVKPVRPAIPAVQLKSWPHNGIDYFILARLEQEGLKPSPPADRPALIRRVSLDLTGIPPTPAEVAAFVNDHSPKAYENVVDRLLASKQYGERMAMTWLDGARYGDSNGYQSDWERFQWRWRDWVLDAYNNNMPYDQFTIKQLAGDLLPNATMDDKIATGFNRNHRINTEGGVIPEEWRVETVIDRVETTSAVFLGLTMGCARCHDHKYDPITQKDFYSFYSFFNNVPESGTGEERPVNHPPYISAPTPEQSKEVADLDGQVKKLDADRTARLASNTESASKWIVSDLGAGAASQNEGLVARYILDAHPHVIAGSGPEPKAHGTITSETGHGTGAVVTDGMSYVDLGNVGDFDTHEQFSYGAWLNPQDGSGSPLSRMDTAHDYRGWDILMQGGRPAVHLINKWPDNALKVTSKEAIPNGQWSHVFITYDGSAKPEGLHIYINGKQVATDVEMNTLTATMHSEVTAKIGTRTGADGYKGKVEDVALYHRMLSSTDVADLVTLGAARSLLAIEPAKRTDAQKMEIARLWSQQNDPTYRDLSTRLADTSKKLSDVQSQITTVMVMDEMPKPRECHVLIRGQYDKPGDVVTAALPASLPPMPPGAPNNRLGLAEWIASPDNPLTARVAVNRYWEKFFGTGLVVTSEDFGTRAEFPTHPELLDWLATEFVRLKWDMKAIQKEIVMSSTYRESSTVTPQLEKVDPENKFLARGPRFRLPAELIRDQALAVAGLLTEHVGGPSVRPYQPAGIWDEISVYGNLHNYMHDKGDNLYRRSMYTIWKRTAPPPEMTLFDAPARETCRIRRSRTDTPLQALVLMNDVTFLEASRVLAQRMLEEGGPTPESRINYVFERVLCRKPTPRETQILTAGLQKRLAVYQAEPAIAQKLLSQGDYPKDPKLDPVQVAAYTMTASVLLNLDETVTRE